MPDLVPLRGSERTELPNVRPAGELDQNETITVTLMLRRRAQVPRELVVGPETLSPAQLGDRYGADPADVALVTQVLGRDGLTVTETHTASRRLKVRGTVAQLSAAFGTTLTLVSSPHPDGTGTVTHRYRSGGLSVPAELAGIVTAVLGLDDRPQARPHFRRLRTVAPETVAPETVAPETVAPEGKRKPRRGHPSRSPRRRSPASTTSRRTPTGPGRPSRSSNSAAATRKATWTRTSAGWAWPRRPSPRSAWTVRRTPPATRPTGRWTWTSRSPARSRPARPRSSTSRRTPTRGSSTRSPRRCTPPRHRP